MPSFDAVCEADWVELRHAVENTEREIATRFDFKGTSAAIALKDHSITLTGDADFQIGQITDVLRAKLSKRNVDVRYLEMGAVKPVGGDKVQQLITIRSGIEAATSKVLQKHIKDSKLKVQAAIQGAVVRVTGAKRDDLQAVIALLQQKMPDLPLSFTNFRD